MLWSVVRKWERLFRVVSCNKNNVCFSVNYVNELRLKLLIKFVMFCVVSLFDSTERKQFVWISGGTILLKDNIILYLFIYMKFWKIFKYFVFSFLHWRVIYFVFTWDYNLAKEMCAKNGQRSQSDFVAPEAVQLLSSFLRSPLKKRHLINLILCGYINTTESILTISLSIYSCISIGYKMCITKCEHKTRAQNEPQHIFFIQNIPISETKLKTQNSQIKIFFSNLNSSLCPVPSWVVKN